MPRRLELSTLLWATSEKGQPIAPRRCDAMSDPGERLTPIRKSSRSALPSILLQKSEVASVRIFGEILKREAIDDSDNLSRVTEVAYEFSARQ